MSVANEPLSSGYRHVGSAIVPLCVLLTANSFAFSWVDHLRNPHSAETLRKWKMIWHCAKSYAHYVFHRDGIRKFSMTLIKSQYQTRDPTCHLQCAPAGPSAHPPVLDSSSACLTGDVCSASRCVSSVQIQCPRYFFCPLMGVFTCGLTYNRIHWDTQLYYPRHNSEDKVPFHCFLYERKMLSGLESVSFAPYQTTRVDDRRPFARETCNLSIYILPGGQMNVVQPSSRYSEPSVDTVLPAPKDSNKDVN
jgi:hypothetical protein